MPTELRFSLRSLLSLTLLVVSISAIFSLFAQQNRTSVDLDTDKQRIRDNVFKIQKILGKLQRRIEISPLEMEANHMDYIQGSSDNTPDKSQVA